MYIMSQLLFGSATATATVVISVSTGACYFHPELYVIMIVMRVAGDEDVRKAA
jgi:hypothetical protein